MLLNGKFCSGWVGCKSGISHWQRAPKQFQGHLDPSKLSRKLHVTLCTRSAPSCPLPLGVRCSKAILSPLAWLRNVHTSTRNCCRFCCLRNFLLRLHHLNRHRVCYLLFPCTPTTLRPSSTAQTGKVQHRPPFFARVFHLKLAPVTYSKWLPKASLYRNFSLFLANETVLDTHTLQRTFFHVVL